MTQSSGQHTVANELKVGWKSGYSYATGNYALSGGSVTAGGMVRSANTVVGATGEGTFEHAGGGHTVTGGLTLGRDAEGSGIYNLSTGALNTSSTYVARAGTVRRRMS